MSQTVNQLRVRCPRCEQEFLYYQSSFRPFCSDRCKMIDMGQWLLESYSVPGQVLGQVDEEEIMSEQTANEEITWEQ